jgi:ABC-type transport system involved in multi-copper enzyme maturation permease subunit
VLNFYYIAKNTFRESLREPIFFILLISAVLLIGLFPSLSLYVFREQIKLVVDSSMATTMVFSLVAAVLAASHTVSREMRNGTVLLLLSKPVKRWNFITAKIIGVIAALTVFVFICNIATMISLKVAKDQFNLDFKTLYIYYGLLLLAGLAGAARNYFYRRSFASTAIAVIGIALPLYIIIMMLFPGKVPSSEAETANSIAEAAKAASIHIEIIPALLLLFFSSWTMGTITVVISTRLDMVANLCLCSIIFIMGLVSNYFLMDVQGSPIKLFLAKVIYAIFPNWQFFWMADAIANQQPVPLAYLLWATLYVVLYISLCSIWGIVAFEDRELAKDTNP